MRFQTGRGMAFQEDRTPGAKAMKTYSLCPAHLSSDVSLWRPRGRGSWRDTTGGIGLGPGFLGGSALH